MEATQMRTVRFDFDESALVDACERHIAALGHSVPEEEPNVTIRHPSRKGRAGVVTLEYRSDE